MGLDQYAGFREPDQKELEEARFYWRKHSRLQTFMEEIWNRRHAADALGIDESNVKGGPAPEFNCESLDLTEEDINSLEAAIQRGYDESPGGFFWGHQFQKQARDQYRDDDMRFVTEARQAMKEGLIPYYYCWW